MCAAYILHFSLGKSRWITGGGQSHIQVNDIMKQKLESKALFSFCFYTPFLHALLSFSRCVSNCEVKSSNDRGFYFYDEKKQKNKTKKAEKTFQNFPLDGLSIRKLYLAF